MVKGLNGFHALHALRQSGVNLHQIKQSFQRSERNPAGLIVIVANQKPVVDPFHLLHYVKMIPIIGIVKSQRYQSAAPFKQGGVLSKNFLPAVGCTRAGMPGLPLMPAGAIEVLIRGLLKDTSLPTRREIGIQPEVQILH